MPRSVALFFSAILFSGCARTPALGELPACASAEPAATPAELAQAYSSIEGVTFPAAMPPHQLAGEYRSSDGLMGARLVLAADSTTARRYLTDLPNLFWFLRRPERGRWSLSGGQAVVVTPSRDRGPDGRYRLRCARTQRYDVVVVEGRPWLVPRAWRRSFSDVVALYKAVGVPEVLRIDTELYLKQDD